MRALGAVLLTLFVWASGAAAADPLRVAREAFHAGDFVAAAEAGASDGGSRGLALAARAWLAHCMTGAEGGDVDWSARQGEAAARAALARDPGSIEARLQLALALGVIGRRASAAEAVREGYAREGHRLIEEVLARDPREPWAHALLGAWHLEVIRRGGRAGAVFYGARREKGFEAFERAIALAPEDPAILLLYAVAALELDPERNAARAGELLAAAARVRPRDALAREMREEARRLGAVLASEGAQAAAALAGGRLG